MRLSARLAWVALKCAVLGVAAAYIASGAGVIRYKPEFVWIAFGLVSFVAVVDALLTLSPHELPGSSSAVAGRQRLVLIAPHGILLAFLPLILSQFYLQRNLLSGEVRAAYSFANSQGRVVVRLGPEIDVGSSLLCSSEDQALELRDVIGARFKDLRASAMTSHDGPVAHIVLSPVGAPSTANLSLYDFPGDEKPVTVVYDRGLSRAEARSFSLVRALLDDLFFPSPADSWRADLRELEPADSSLVDLFRRGVEEAVRPGSDDPLEAIRTLAHVYRTEPGWDLARVELANAIASAVYRGRHVEVENLLVELDGLDGGSHLVAILDLLDAPLANRALDAESKSALAFSLQATAAIMGMDPSWDPVPRPERESVRLRIAAAVGGDSELERTESLREFFARAARGLYASILDEYPDNYIAVTSQITLSRYLGDFDAAKSWLERASAHTLSDSPTTLIATAVLLIADEGAPDYQRAIERATMLLESARERGSCGLAQYNLACIEARTGNLGSAQELLRSAASMGDFNYGFLLENDPDLREVRVKFPGLVEEISRPPTRPLATEPVSSQPGIL